MNKIITVWKDSLNRLLNYYEAKRGNYVSFFLKLFLFFFLLNIGCYWWAIFTAFPELTHGHVGAHYFKVQFPVGFLGALFDSLSFFITIVIIRHALRSKNSYVYVGHLSIDLIIAVLATFWVLFVFSFSGWLVNIVESNVPQMAEVGVLVSRNERYQRMLVEAVSKPTDNYHNIYFGLVMGISSCIPTCIHFLMFFYSLVLRKNININSGLVKKAGLVFAILFVVSSFFILRFLFEEEEYKEEIKFNTVYSGEIAEAEYIGTNSSSNDITISKVKTSCGCTVANYPKGPIKSKEDYSIQASINTVYKTGKITKRIYVHFKDKKKPLEIRISGEVLPQPDSHISEKGPGIFSNACGACHANPGKGRKGFQLYLADCAVCHGIFREGLSAPPIPVSNFIKLSDESIGNIISNGVADQTMPAFSIENDGPLNKDQIESLVKFLKEEIPEVKYPEDTPNDTGGRNIYGQLCSTCHGPYKSAGGIGPSIAKAGLNAEEMKDLIENGKPDSVMVSFLREKGGVLERDEVESLVQFINH